MTKVSVIVPVYKTEEYLEKCLDSLVNQTLEDIEIIVINDGSPDNSTSIIEKYAQKDRRIVVIHQENQGLSIARNNGVKIANGDFIGFVDSDDWVDKDFFEKLYNAAVKYDCDISAATIIRKRPKSQKYRVHYTEEKIYTTLEEKIKCCDIPRCCYIWNKLYKKELIKDKPFVVGAYFEDVLWTPSVLKAANKLVTVPDTSYYYWVNSNSIVKNNNSKKQNDNYKANKYIIKFFNENGLALTDKQQNLTKQIYYIGKLPVVKIKEFKNRETFLLFGLIPFFKKKGGNNA